MSTPEAALDVAAGAPAAPSFAVPSTTVVEPVTGVGAMLEILLALSAVLAAILVIAWLVRRMRGSADPGGLIRVLADVSLGQKERAVLLQVDGRRLLVGVAPGSVSMLLCTEADASDALSSDASTASGASAPSFSALLRRSLGRS